MYGNKLCRNFYNGIIVISFNKINRLLWQDQKQSKWSVYESRKFDSL